MDIENGINGDYIVVKALTPNVQIIGMTRGAETKPHHTEMLDKGEAVVIQFTDKTSLIKIRGNSEIYTKYGVIKTER